MTQPVVGHLLIAPADATWDLAVMCAQAGLHWAGSGKDELHHGACP